MTAFYNEIDPYAADWLRNLIEQNLIAPGVVDTRDLRDIEPHELSTFTQCHFFAGIGIWSYALRQAGVPDDTPLWTGSCPCQPFSAAGRAAGFADERHLWPHWFHLISVCRPPVVLGEQVASKDGLGFLDLVQSDLEGAGYAVGAADLCAAGFAGAHLRQRLYFVGLGDGIGPGLEGHTRDGDHAPGRTQPVGPASAPGSADGLADAADTGPQLQPGEGPAGVFDPSAVPQECLEQLGGYCPSADDFPEVFEADWLFCRDGKWRPVEPLVQQVVDEVALRVGPMCPKINNQIEELIGEAALRFSTTREEILRALRGADDPQNLRGQQGGESLTVAEAQVLLASLLELTRSEWTESHLVDGSGPVAGPLARLRVLWGCKEAGDPSCERGLEGQPLSEFADFVRSLSSTVARFAQESGYPVLYTYAPASYPLGEWGGGSSQNRVGRLRAFGNGLDAKTAQGFIEAVLCS